jgi:molybdate transport system substrate-binding protein
MTQRLRGISSMATRSLLGALCAGYRASGGPSVEFQAVGGVEVPRRLRKPTPLGNDEPFDLVVLAESALQALAGEGLVVAAAQKAFAVSPAALAVRTGASKPPIGTAQELIRALRNAGSIGYSTGPSGDALLQLLDRAGILREVRPRLLQSPPGVPVASLVAEGRVEIGMQQLSELIGADGIEVIGTLPEGMRVDTIFAAAVCADSRQPREAMDFLAYPDSPAVEAVIRHAYMSPYRQPGTAGEFAT